MKVGVFQSSGGRLTAIERIERLEAHIVGQDLELVVCPELFMSGYDVGEQITTLAEPQDGFFAKKAAALAKKHQTAITYGYPERTGDKIFNSALCLSAAGNVIANHRKFLPPPGFEATYFSEGSGLTSFELGGLNFAILICYDAEFPETVRAAAKAGADVIIVPTALVDQWQHVARCTMPARAFENGVWLLYSNHAGSEGTSRYLGESCIVAPTGKDVARAGLEETLITAEIDKDAVNAAQTRMPYLDNLNRLQALLGSD